MVWAQEYQTNRCTCEVRSTLDDDEQREKNAQS